MGKNILIIQGHPDSAAAHLGHRLAEAYTQGAERNGHRITRLDVAQLSFPLLHSKDEWENSELPVALIPAQNAILATDHLVLIYPLWQGTMPAMLKAFLEQVLRPGVITTTNPAGKPVRRLRGKSARIIVTMGMPAFFYRWFFRAHSLKNVERNIFKLIGVKPVRNTLVGGVESMSRKRGEKILAEIEKLGARGI